MNNPQSNEQNPFTTGFFYVESAHFTLATLKQHPYFETFPPILLAACCNYLHFHYSVGPLVDGIYMKVIHRKLNELAASIGFTEADREQVGLKFAWQVASYPRRSVLGYFGGRQPRFQLDAGRNYIRESIDCSLRSLDAYFVTAARSNLRRHLERNTHLGYHTAILPIERGLRLPSSPFWPIYIRGRETSDALCAHGHKSESYHQDTAESSVLTISAGQFESNRRRH